jgi:hypothetical protein
MATATSSGSEQDALGAARRLREGLSDLADALETGRLAAVLDAEPRLATAVAAISAIRPRLMPGDLDPRGAVALRTELEAASAALRRCAALGLSLDDLVRGRCSSGVYGASGQAVPVRVRGAVEELV